MATAAVASPTPAAKPAAAKAAVSKGPMTATWHLKDPSTWNWYQRMIVRFDILQHGPGAPEPPRPPKDAKVPVYPLWRQHLFIFPRAVAPLLIHWAFTQLTGYKPHPVLLFFYYFIGMKRLMTASLRKFNRIGHRYGYFDSEVPRDGIPDNMGQKVFWSMVGTVGLRVIFGLAMIYDREKTDLLDIHWYLPFELGLYAVILDFWFYVYHRSMHEIPFLWKFHRLHHVTKHPNPLLSGFADVTQEWFDILVIPMLTHLVFPTNFPTWFICQGYIMYTEAMGHAGIRVYFPTVMTAPFLRPFNAELCLEDHDQHHRSGWRKSANYGKQSRLWDVLFGTSRPRVECTEEQLDWDNPVTMM